MAANGTRLPRKLVQHPGQVVVIAFAVAVLVGTVLLMLPGSRAGPESAGPLTALFTATSAVCVTGLATVDTGTYWSPFGQVVILALIQIGGFGIMTMASLLGVLVSRRLGLRARLTAAAETKTLGIGDIRSVLLGVAAVTVLVEALVSAALTARLMVGYDEPFDRAWRVGVFHAVSAFNNAGFSTYPDNLTRFATDGWILLPVAVAVVLGGLGFPVILELRRRHVFRHWSLHAKLTVTTTAALLLLGWLFFTFNEWRNPATLGSMDPASRLLNGFFHSAMTRTAGFNSIDMADVSDGTLLGTVGLMFIGGGSAGTAGGIKVTTFVLLAFVIWAEVRGEPNVDAFGRQIDPRVQRQALAVALLGVGIVVSATLLLLETTSLRLADALFEVTSAFGTVGLSTGVTAGLPAFGQLVLVALMFLGRLGPITLVSALALRERPHHYQLPRERPIIG